MLKTYLTITLTGPLSDSDKAAGSKEIDYIVSRRNLMHRNHKFTDYSVLRCPTLEYVTCRARLRVPTTLGNQVPEVQLVGSFQLDIFADTEPCASSRIKTLCRYWVIQRPRSEFSISNIFTSSLTTSDDHHGLDFNVMHKLLSNWLQWTRLIIRLASTLEQLHKLGNHKFETLLYNIRYRGTTNKYNMRKESMYVNSRTQLLAGIALMVLDFAHD